MEIEEVRAMKRKVNRVSVKVLDAWSWGAYLWVLVDYEIALEWICGSVD